MTFAEVMKQLKSEGTAQNRKVYSRHGVANEMFGVSYSVQRRLVKQIKQDHELAIDLWKSGNHDARILATMIADPAKGTLRLLDEWAGDLKNYVLTDAFSAYAGKTSVAKKASQKWRKRRDEFRSAAGWNIITHLAINDDTISNSELLENLETITKEIHSVKNRTRHAMNGAIIAIGTRNEELRKAAEAAAKKIGHIEVDHGETNCKTPDAIAYIEKTWTHRTARRRKTC